MTIGESRSPVHAPVFFRLGSPRYDRDANTLECARTASLSRRLALFEWRRPCPRPKFSGARSSSCSLIVLTTIWAATQWTAWRLGFQPQLGHPWFELAGLPVYLPPAFFWWWYAFDAYAPAIFVEGGYIAASGGLHSPSRSRSPCRSGARARPKNVETYGSARWARPDEMKAAGLLGPDGVVLGRLRATPICATTDRSMCSASPRRDPARASASSCRRC